MQMPGEGNGLRRVPMMDGSDHSRRALARRGLEMGGQGPQGRLEFCPIQLDTVQLNWTWFSSRSACLNRPTVDGVVRALEALQESPEGALVFGAGRP